MFAIFPHSRTSTHESCHWPFETREKSLKVVRSSPARVDLFRRDKYHRVGDNIVTPPLFSDACTIVRADCTRLLMSTNGIFPTRYFHWHLSLTYPYPSQLQETASYHDKTMMRKVLFLLLATFAAASASTFQVQSVTKPTAFRPKQVLDIPRGGGGIDTAAVVKAHGYTAVLVAGLWAVETLGVEVPLMGLAATIKGFDMNNGATKFFVRFLASVFIFVAQVEMNMSDNAQVQQYFKMYHVPAALSAIMLAKDHAKGPLGWMFPALVSAFTVASIAV
jgi:hypothetical protein